MITQTKLKIENENKLIYNDIYVSDTINKYLKIVEFEDSVIFPLVFTKEDFEYISSNYQNPNREYNQHQFLNLLFIGSITSDFIKMDDNSDGCEFDVYFNQQTLNKLNGILYSYEKRIGKPISLDNIIKKLIDKEYSRKRDEHYKSFREVREIYGDVMGYE